MLTFAFLLCSTLFFIEWMKLAKALHNFTIFTKISNNANLTIYSDSNVSSLFSVISEKEPSYLECQRPNHFQDKFETTTRTFQIINNNDKPYELEQNWKIKQRDAHLNITAFPDKLIIQNKSEEIIVLAQNCQNISDTHLFVSKYAVIHLNIRQNISDSLFENIIISWDKICSPNHQENLFDYQILPLYFISFFLMILSARFSKIIKYTKQFNGVPIGIRFALIQGLIVSLVFIVQLQINEKWSFYVMKTVFSIFSLSCCLLLGKQYFQKLFFYWCTGDSSMTLIKFSWIIASVLSIALLTAWFIWNYWFLTSLVAILTLIALVKTFYFHSLKRILATFSIILSIDLFWALFITFQTTYSFNNLLNNAFIIPLKLECPCQFLKTNFQCNSMLITQIMFPALFLNYCQRFDASQQRIYYAWTSIISLIFGFGTAVFSIFFLDFQIPLTIIIIPILIIVSLIVAYLKGVLKAFWEGHFIDNDILDKVFITLQSSEEEKKGKVDNIFKNLSQIEFNRDQNERLIIFVLKYKKHILKQKLQNQNSKMQDSKIWLPGEDKQQLKDASQIHHLSFTQTENPECSKRIELPSETPAVHKICFKEKNKPSITIQKRISTENKNPEILQDVEENSHPTNNFQQSPQGFIGISESEKKQIDDQGSGAFFKKYPTKEKIITKENKDEVYKKKKPLIDFESKHQDSNEMMLQMEKMKNEQRKQKSNKNYDEEGESSPYKDRSKSNHGQREHKSPIFYPKPRNSWKKSRKKSMEKEIDTHNQDSSTYFNLNHEPIHQYLMSLHNFHHQHSKWLDNPNCKHNILNYHMMHLMEIKNLPSEQEIISARNKSKNPLWNKKYSNEKAKKIKKEIESNEFPLGQNVKLSYSDYLHKDRTIRNPNFKNK